MADAPPPAAETSTQLAIERTRLAYERTLMAWVRTAVSLISFGFTIYKFFEFEAGKNLPGVKSALLTPRAFAMLMITTGLVSLALATYDFRRNTKWMATPHGYDGRFVSTSVAAIVSGMGLLALAAAFLRA